MALGVGVSGELIHSPHPEEPIAAIAAVGVSKGEGACSVSAAILRDGRRKRVYARLRRAMGLLRMAMFPDLTD
ncbi:MAG: hypothetical protein QOH67_4801 [Hyphomicrobiales bacterium]|jgi:hypothetical protein|nr:hypothetical protein [Hyphomicrobiales bacterium]